MNDTQLIGAIANRAAQLFVNLGIVEEDQETFVRTATLMEVGTVHREVIALRLTELLEADDGNFAHDIGGIHRHLEFGSSGRWKPALTDGFCPRFAVMQ